MKLLIVLALVALAVARPEEELYSSKYDDFDADGVTANDRLLSSYAHCFIGDGKCTAEGNYFKKVIPEAVPTSCGKCSEKQKGLVAKVLKAIKTKLPDEYATLNKMYNPENKYDSEIQSFLDKYA